MRIEPSPFFKISLLPHPNFFFCLFNIYFSPVDQSINTNLWFVVAFVIFTRNENFKNTCYSTRYRITPAAFPRIINMTKSNFLTLLKRSINYSSKRKISHCRCTDCYSKRQSHQDKTGDTSSK